MDDILKGDTQETMQHVTELSSLFKLVVLVWLHMWSSVSSVIRQQQAENRLKTPAQHQTAHTHEVSNEVTERTEHTARLSGV